MTTNGILSKTDLIKICENFNLNTEGTKVDLAKRFNEKIKNLFLIDGDYIYITSKHKTELEHERMRLKAQQKMKGKYKVCECCGNEYQIKIFKSLSGTLFKQCLYCRKKMASENNE